MGVVLVFRAVTKQKNEESFNDKITAVIIKCNKIHQHFSRNISHNMRLSVVMRSSVAKFNLESEVLGMGLYMG